MLLGRIRAKANVNKQTALHAITAQGEVHRSSCFPVVFPYGDVLLADDFNHMPDNETIPSYGEGISAYTETVMMSILLISRYGEANFPCADAILSSAEIQLPSFRMISPYAEVISPYAETLSAYGDNVSPYAEIVSPIRRSDTDGRKLRNVVRRSNVGARHYAASVRRRDTSMRRHGISGRVADMVVVICAGIVTTD